MKCFVTAVVFLGLTIPALYGQTEPQPALELSQAETQALANQPRMLAAQLRARAFAERTKQARAG